MTTGLIACAVALALAMIAGLGFRARNGRLRQSPGRREREFPAASQAAAGPAAAGLSADDLGRPLGSRATLVQFSSEFCAPCRATRQLLADVAAVSDGVTHVEIDAESRLDLVRRLNVRRTPTTFVLGPDGQITHKASGQPRKAEVLAALASAPAFPS